VKKINTPLKKIKKVKFAYIKWLASELANYNMEDWQTVCGIWYKQNKYI